MPKATRTSANEAPKKRTRKAKTETGNGTEVVLAMPTPAIAHLSQPSEPVEEQIRARAYQIFLKRGGNGGSPEQDWIQAKEEVLGQRSA